jgi:acetolactate synthase-1/2/3 large subunit
VRRARKYVEDDTIVIGDGGDFVATAAYTLPMQCARACGWIRARSARSAWARATRWRPSSRARTARVILVYGDGSFGLHGLEFEAMARQGIKVVAVIGNDAGWTQILRGQATTSAKSALVATKLDYTRYDKVVEAVGGKGFWVDTAEGLAPALKAAFECPEPALVNVKIASSDFRKGSISV